MGQATVLIPAPVLRTRPRPPRRLDAIDGGTVAAEAQQAAPSLAARVAKESHTYARVRLAGAVVGRLVHVYRE
jgi:hypothetical protein